MNNDTLWIDYKKQPTVDIKKQIIKNYLNLVHYVIHRSKFASINVFEYRDYFQFGVEGLNQAVERFDPGRGQKFEYYAIKRIRGKIIDEIRKTQMRPRKLSFGIFGDLEYSILSMDNSDGNENSTNFHDVLPSSIDTPLATTEKNERKEILIKAVKNLRERERLIIQLYYYEYLTYEEISAIIGLGVPRISQIHSKIINSLKLKLQHLTT